MTAARPVAYSKILQDTSRTILCVLMLCLHDPILACLPTLQVASQASKASKLLVVGHLAGCCGALVDYVTETAAAAAAAAAAAVVMVAAAAACLQQSMLQQCSTVSRSLRIWQQQQLPFSSHEGWRGSSSSGETCDLVQGTLQRLTCGACLVPATCTPMAVAANTAAMAPTPLLPVPPPPPPPPSPAAAAAAAAAMSVPADVC